MPVLSSAALRFAVTISSLILQPGLTLVSGTGAVTSAQPGSINCVGLIAGSPVTGPGTFSVAGKYSGTCAQGLSSGQSSYAIPTQAGTAAGTMHYTLTWVGAVGVITVDDPVYGTGNGPFDMIPVTGNCITAPLTVIRWSSHKFVLTT